MLQRDGPPLSRCLHDLDAPHQPILPRDPHRRCGVRQIGRVRLERDHIDAAVRERIGPHIAGVVTLTGPFDKLPDQIRSGRSGAGDRAADHLTRRAARCVEPQLASIGDDAVVLRLAEAHGEVVRPALEQRAPRRIGIAEHRVVDDLHEVGRQGADRVEGCGGAVEDRPGILRNDGMMERWNEYHHCNHSNIPSFHRSSLHAPTAAGSATRRPIASAIIRTSRISCMNWSGYSDCAPSESASSGFGCTSTMMPSAPAATAARAIGITLSRKPVPWDGSAMIGRCESLCTTGMTVRSKRLRVAVSKLRTPRSHRMTSWFPSASRYSADSSSSCTVALIPRLRSTGLPQRPASLSSEKFCMLRAPSCTMSDISATQPRPVSSIASVQIRSPVSSRALASSRRPGLPSPWNEYGELRGFQAPPRSTTAPASFTWRAASMIWRSVSTEQGPAIATTSVPPNAPPPGRRTTVGSAFHSRLTCLYGCETWMTSWTPGRPSRREASTRPSLPTRPTAVRCTPGMACA